MPGPATHPPTLLAACPPASTFSFQHLWASASLLVSQVLELGVGPGRGLRGGWGTLPLGPQSRELEKGVGGLSCEMTCHPNCHG